MEMLVIKEGMRLNIVDTFAEDFAKLPNGVYRILLRRDRNPQLHRKFFAILKGWAEYRNLDLAQSLLVLKILLGEVETVEYKEKQIVIPKSISFAAMDEVEFQEFYKKAILYISNDIGISEIELEQGVEE